MMRERGFEKFVGLLRQNSMHGIILGSIFWPLLILYSLALEVDGKVEVCTNVGCHGNRSDETCLFSPVQPIGAHWEGEE